MANVQESIIPSFVPSTSAIANVNARPSKATTLCPPPPLPRGVYSQSAVGSETSHINQDPGFSGASLEADDGALHVHANANTASDDIVMHEDTHDVLPPRTLCSESSRKLRSNKNNLVSTKAHLSVPKRAVAHDADTNPVPNISQTLQSADNGKQHNADLSPQADLPTQQKREKTAQIMELLKAAKPEVTDDSHNEQLAQRVKLIIDQRAEDSDIHVNMTTAKEDAPGEDAKGRRKFKCNTCNAKWHCHSDLK